MQYRLRRVDSDKEPKYSYMTKYERAIGIGKRARHIIEGKEALIAIKKETDVQRIAEIELEQNVLPIVFRRYIPETGENEDWELDVDQHIFKDLTSNY